MPAKARRERETPGLGSRRHRRREAVASGSPWLVSRTCLLASRSSARPTSTMSPVRAAPAPGRDADRRGVRAHPGGQGREPGGRGGAARRHREVHRADRHRRPRAALTRARGRRHERGGPRRRRDRRRADPGRRERRERDRVAPGANRRLAASDVDVGEADAVISQLEIPFEAVAAAAAQARFFCLNVAPARGPIELEADLLIVNRYEYEQVLPVSRAGGADARPRGRGTARSGHEVARAHRPRSRRWTGRRPGTCSAPRSWCRCSRAGSGAPALERACVAGALAASARRRAAVAADRRRGRRADALMR